MVLNAHLDGCVTRSRSSAERFLRLRGLIREEDGVTVYTTYELLTGSNWPVLFSCSRVLHGTWIIDFNTVWRASRPCFPLIVSPWPRETPLPDYTEAQLPLEFVLAFTYSLMFIRLDVVIYAKIASIEPRLMRITLWCARHEKSLSSRHGTLQLLK